MDLRHCICWFLLFRLGLFTGQIPECRPGQWQCDDGGCIPELHRCDGEGDCLDGSDELDCDGPHTCPRGQFSCVDSVNCVDMSARCDGRKQCPTGYDEESCEHLLGCLDSEWSCSNRMCISKELRCNGQDDCLDNSDELDCGQCNVGVKCSDGTCISPEKMCDRTMDCDDGRDEPVTCERSCSISNGGCSHSCADEPWGARCSCPPGYELTSDGATCLDVDECSRPKVPCMHACINTVGSYFCKCTEGFTLSKGSMCLATGTITKLLTVQRTSLGLLDVKSRQMDVLQFAVYEPVALAFDLTRTLYYWADSHGSIHKTDGRQTREIYAGHPGIKSLACDWLNGQLYWTNQVTKTIYMQGADGGSYTTVLSKNINPSDLVVLPVESLMFWINTGPGDRVSIEKSWMDGSDRSSLAVLTAQAAHGLTLDVAARRLYWISDSKQSIETVMVDGNGRDSFRGAFSQGPVLNLASFERLFYWTDKKGLWQASRTNLNQKRLIWKDSPPLFSVYHQLQQPQVSSPCVMAQCALCMLSKSNPVGFKCTCPNSQVLLPNGACEYPRIVYGTALSINYVEFKDKEVTDEQLFTTDEGIQSFDIDWYRDWFYWANRTGNVKRNSLTEIKAEIITTSSPVCMIKVDQRSGNLFWVSCDQKSINVITADRQGNQKLYNSKGLIEDLYLDWLRGGLLWLEGGRIFTMNMMGGKPLDLLKLGEGVVGKPAFDLRANGLLWNSYPAGLVMMSLFWDRRHVVGKRWDITGSVVYALEPFLLSLSDKTMTLWDRRDGIPIESLSVRGDVLGVIGALKDLNSGQNGSPATVNLVSTQSPRPAMTQTCRSPSILCPQSSIFKCISSSQICNGVNDCPDGFDESNCVKRCASNDFLCNDHRSCVSQNLVCDGWSHCLDGSDEMNCPSFEPPSALPTVPKCRHGTRLCADGSACVVFSHVCDGDWDCADGSDEAGCDGVEVTPRSQIIKTTPFTPLSTELLCRSPSVLCPGSSVCLRQTQFCDGKRDCPDGSDEKCVNRCPYMTDFLCKDRRKCVSQTQVCDGRSHCFDASDEMNCPSYSESTSQLQTLKCRHGTRACADGSGCVLFSHVCDGDKDCTDGSDEAGCDGAENLIKEKESCPGQTVQCPESSRCILQTQICDGKRDCPDGSDENCGTTCPNTNDFLCKDSLSCISKSLVCNGRSDCRDGSDENNCANTVATFTKSGGRQCPRTSKLCKDGSKCVLLGHLCDGEEDCPDGSDENNCANTVTTSTPSGGRQCPRTSKLCKDGSKCVLLSHLCDGEDDCPDGSDELQCPTSCKQDEFQCAHGRMCIPVSQVCDGKIHCLDHSDETNCHEQAKSCEFHCRDGKRCLPKKFLCDGEKDCGDGSDEEGCAATTKRPEKAKTSRPYTRPPAQPQCRSPSVLCPGSSVCLRQNQFCDGKRDCPGGSDENNCANTVTTSTPSGGRQCPRTSKLCKDGSKCVLLSHLCDGEEDCPDGSDELQCPTSCKQGEFQCVHGKVCIPVSQVCDGKIHCRDHSDEINCHEQTKSCEFHCRDGKRCLPKKFLCDGEKDCVDGSDEEGCSAIKTVTKSPQKTQPLRQNTHPPTLPACRSPSVLCPGSSVCLRQNQFCDGKRDCPDGSDEKCVDSCPSMTDFLCNDHRSCVSQTLVCDGRSHCLDASDEINCPSLEPPTDPPIVLKCRHGTRLCSDGSACVVFSHLCDGDWDCTDGSDEAGCDEKAIAATTSRDQQRSCPSPSLLCPESSHCILPTQFCDGKQDCPDGSDENCGATCSDTNDFLCKDGLSCISKGLVCNGRSDCRDGSDENNCANTVATFTKSGGRQCPRTSKLCKDGSKCVLLGHLCDGEEDCPDGSDENNCANTVTTSTPSGGRQCPRTSKLCKDGSKCVLLSHLCDGEEDCPDGSDEQQCPTTCKQGEFQCAHGRMCIPVFQVCDGKIHCLDHSDETNCHEQAKSCEFHCRDGKRCLPKKFLCDGEKDCGDGSDEEGCAATTKRPEKAKTSRPYTRPPAQPQCRSPSVLCPDSSVCLRQNQFCDGKRDCPDGSDENNCANAVTTSTLSGGRQCPRTSKLCKDGSKCVLLSHLCDGEEDCPDGSDELQCPTSCKQDEFQCAHGKMCIPVSQVCDGKIHCLDHSDETNCHEQTKSCEFHCRDGKRCLPKKFLCDGEKDCGDGSDEEGCGTSVEVGTSSCTSPSVLCPGSTVCVSQEQFCDKAKDCPDGFDEQGCVFFCNNPADFLCRDKRKCIQQNQVCDGRANCFDRSDERQCPAASNTAGSSSPLKCRHGSKLCKNGLQCVMYNHLCDGQTDCKDGSDEANCATKCKAEEFQCGHGKRCIPKEQVCDGQIDCQDQSDEVNCRSQGENCNHWCEKSRCIPETFICDGERDCADGSDESKCGVVTCASNQYRCKSGQCVSLALRCDGYADCTDRSDEKDCARPPRCPSGLRCPKGHQCLQKEWVCDGENDCLDGADEKSCKKTSVTCKEYQWRCGDSECIPLSWKCDGKEDCANGKDEDQCKKKCAAHLYTCGNGQCLDPWKVCNGVTDCADGSDEGHGCKQRNCSNSSAPQCDHHCVSTPSGPRCFCAAGFKRSKALFCVDVDECGTDLTGVCKHICRNTRGSFACRCHPGFYLEPDNRSCKTKDEPLLLASVQTEMVIRGVHSGTLRMLSSGNRPVFSMDYHWAQSRIYWLSSNYQSIRWANISNTNSKGTLIKGVKSDFIAVDWVGKNLYWVDGLLGQILAVKLSNVTLKAQDYTVVLGVALEQPSSLLLVSHKGLMFWSEIGSTPQIEQAGMDGSKRKVVVSRGLSWPVSLAFDVLDNRIYWADEKLRCIGSASMEGKNLKILQLVETPSPFSVAVFNDRVFWSDTKKRSIRSADKRTGKDQKVLVKRPGQPFGLKIMHALSQPSVSNPCDLLPCSHLCLLAPAVRSRSGGSKRSKVLTAVCRCPKGLRLSKDNLKCTVPRVSSFIMLLSLQTIYQVHLRSMTSEGVGLKHIPDGRVLALPGVNEASSMDVSIPGLSVFVADSALAAVDKLKLSDGSRQALIADGQILKLSKNDVVSALAVDWVTSNLYWSSSKRPNLHVTSDKGHTASLLPGAMKGTTSIAVHPPSGRLCYTTVALLGSNQAEVSCAWMDGQRKAVLWRRSSVPTALVFSDEGTMIYWADTGDGVIYTIGVDGSGFNKYNTGPGFLIAFTFIENFMFWMTLEKDVTRLWYSDGEQPKHLWFETKISLIELKAYSNNSQSGKNSCSSNNGGCSHLCLPYPGGHTCHCGQGFYTVNVTSCAQLPSCPADGLPCPDGSKCISTGQFCDGNMDCPDGFDEQDCPYTDFGLSGPNRNKSSPLKSPLAASDTNAGKKSEVPCDLQCNGHGSCITEGTVSRCHCSDGYKGEFCQVAETSHSRAGLVLGLLFLCALVVTAVFLYVKRRELALALSTTREKETLMSNIGLPSEQTYTDGEELDSPVDEENRGLTLESLELKQ